MEDKKKLRRLCKKGKFKDLLKALRTTEELKLGLEPDLSQPLHYFAGRGNLVAVRELIEKYECDPQCQNLHGITPLHCACYCGRSNIVKYLVAQQKCDVNLRDKQGVCPLGYTAYCIMKEVTVMSPLNYFRNERRSEYAHIAKILSDMEDVCVTPNELCVLRIPVYCDSKFAVFLLMENNLKRKLGGSSTELHYEIANCLEIAIRESKWGFAKNLWHFFVEESKSHLVQAFSTSNCFHTACTRGNLEFIRTFLQFNICKPDAESVKIAIDGKHYELVSLLIKSADHPLLMDRYKTWSCLLSYIFECHRHDQKLTKLVVTATISGNLMDVEGNSPLHLACKYSVTHVIQDYSCYQNTVNGSQELPLHVACKTKRFEILKHVSSQLEDDINTKDLDGNTPLHLVCNSLSSCYGAENKVFDCCKYLILEKKCDINIQNNLGELPLHILLRSFLIYDHKARLLKDLTAMISKDRSLKVNAQDSSGNTPMHIACMKNNVDAVLCLASENACNLNLINEDGCLPLHYALSSIMPLEAVKAVACGCTKKHIQNKGGKTPLHIACENYDPCKDKMVLLELIGDIQCVNVQDASDNTPLHYACIYRDSEAVFYFTSKLHCDVNLLNHNQCLALHYALESKLSLKTIKAISSECTLKHIQNQDGKTPLHIACEVVYDDIDREILLELVSATNYSVNSQDHNGDTPLHISCKRGNDKNALYLMLNLNCSVDLQNHDQCLVLHNALMSHMPLDVIKEICIRCTLKHKQDKFGKTPLHIACKNAKYYSDEERKDLLELVGDVKGINIQDTDGNTPLHIACIVGDLQSALYLVSNCHCDVNVLNDDQCLPIHYAIKSSKAMEMVKIVSNGWSLMHLPNKNEMTPLHLACKQKRLDVAKYLVFESGCFPNQCHPSAIYDSLDIRLACKAETDLPLLKALANEKNINNTYRLLYHDDTEVTPIHVACTNHNLVAIELLIELNCDLSSKDLLGRLPLHIACSKGLKCVEVMMPGTKNDDINVCDINGDTPLHFAVKENHLDIVKFILLNFVCDINIPNKKGELPLHMACTANSPEMIKILIDGGASGKCNDKTKDGDSPLHIACRIGVLDTVKYLVEACDCKPSMIVRNSEGRLPVDYACKHSLEMVELVIQSCSIEDLVSREYKSSYWSYTYWSDHNKCTTLDIACSSGALNIVMYLIDKRGCSLSALGNDHSALRFACGLMRDKTDGQNHPWPEVVQFLISKCGYDPSLSFNCRSVCEYACQQKDIELMKALTVKTVDITDEEGNTPLHYACLHNCVDIAQFLVDLECDQKVFNNEGQLAIHIACYTSLEITRMLTTCDIHSVNDEGNTALHIACNYRQEDVVKYLIDELKCDVNVPNGEGECAIHIACKKSLKIQNLVLKSDINCQDAYGVTPLHIACSKCDYEMVLFLLNHGCRTDIPNENGDLALHTLVKAKNPDSDSYDSYDSYHSLDEQSVSVDVSHVVELIVKQNIAAALTANHDGDTPIDMAVMSNDTEVLDILFNLSEIDEKTRNRLLHSACATGWSQSVCWLIDHGASTEAFNDEGNLPQHTCFQQYCNLETLKELGPIDITKQDKNCNTILHLACKSSRSDVLQYILQSLDNCSKYFSIQNKDKDTPLHLLAINRIYSPEIVTLIQCEDPNLKNENGNTPLHLACQHGNLDLARHLLISCQCNPNISNDESKLPLHIAADKLKLSLVKLLASPDNINIQTKSGNTPLHIACKHYNATEVIKVLLKFNFDRNITNNEGNTALHIAAATSLELVKLVATSENLNLPNKKGDTPLHIACQYRQWEIISYLIMECECLVDIHNTNSNSAFHILLSNYVSYTYISWEEQKCVLSLIPNALTNKTNNDGDTLLHIACRKTDEEIVLFLLESAGCELDALNLVTGATPLHFACYRGFTKVVESYCSKSMNTSIYVSFISEGIEIVAGDTPLHIASRKGKFDIAKSLLKCGHKEALKCCNVRKELPIHLACYQSKAMIDLFSSYKTYFDCNAVNESGDTALHIVCRNNPTTYFVKLLVQKMKCRIDITNKVGNLPLHIFCQGKKISSRVMRLLSTALSEDMLRLRNQNGQTALHELLKCPHEEYQEGHFKSIFQMFIKRGLLDIGNENSEEFLCLACRYQKLDIVKLLCDMYISSSMDIPQSALYEACLNANNGILEYMLQTFNHDINIPNEDGDLPLHLAIRTSVCQRSTMVLIKATKNINHTNLAGNAPLHELYSRCKIQDESQSFMVYTNFYVYNDEIMLKAFLNVADINLSVKNLDGETPLHCMCTDKWYNNDLKLVLTHKSADVNIQNKKGVTVLHIACEANNYEAVQLLISSGADPSMKDNEGQAPITLTTDTEIIKLLIEHGADPQPLYTIHRRFFENFSCEKPPPTPVNLMVIGHPSVGKTTLIQSLQSELNKEVISEKFGHTAGVIPTNFNSQFYGEVTLYDFAGQPEYYASHDAVMHNTIKNVPPIILIVTDLSKSDNIIRDQLHYWINFIGNRCASLDDKAHLIVIGSHADFLESRGMNPSEKLSQFRDSVEIQVVNKMICLKGFIDLNCTKSYSDKITILRNVLQDSTSGLRETGVMHFSSHCFYVFLIHNNMFRGDDFVTLGRVRNALKLKARESKNNPLFVLPSNLSAMIKLCQDLNAKGHLIFIEHPSIMNLSWLILNKVPLLNKVIGNLFAPNDFPQHYPMSYSTGVVPLSQFDQHLGANYPASLTLTFLSRMEYCREITDKVVLQSIVEGEEFPRVEKYYFFPNLVSRERPTSEWSSDPNFSYKCGWLIQCTTDGEYFSPHFIQALLLRLTFLFTPKKIGYDTNDLETYKHSSDSDESSKVKPFVINRFCSVWKNGIYWQEESGVKTIVDIIHQRTLVLLLQCLNGCEIELVRRRSQIIAMILNAKTEFCSEAKIIEYFIHPKFVIHPLPNLDSIQGQLFSFPRVKNTIVKKQPCVINEHNQSVKLEDLLYFEPYSEMCMDTIKSKMVQIYENMEQLSIFRGRQPPQGYGEAPSMSSVPRLHHLDRIEGNGKHVEVIRTAASKWKQLATRLYFEPSDISRIRSDNPSECREACWEVCNEWLCGVGRKPTTWTTLIEALKEAELSEVAADLKIIIAI